MEIPLKIKFLNNNNESKRPLLFKYFYKAKQSYLIFYTFKFNSIQRKLIFKLYYKNSIDFCLKCTKFLIKIK